MKKDLLHSERCTDDRLQLVEKILKNDWVNLSDKINKIEDHEGVLMVYWDEEPSEDDMKKVDDIWYVFNEETVQHYVTYLFRDMKIY